MRQEIFIQISIYSHENLRFLYRFIFRAIVTKLLKSQLDFLKLLWTSKGYLYSPHRVLCRELFSHLDL